MLGDLILRAYPAAPRDADRARGRLHDRRLAVLARHAPAARVLRPQPPAAPVDRPREPTTEAEALLRELGVAPEETPVVIWRGSEVLRNPSNAELASVDRPARCRRPADDVARPRRRRDRAGRAWRPPSTAPPRGSTTVALDAVATGGQAGTSSQIENYLGFPAGISGAELAERATIQAEKFGAADRRAGRGDVAASSEDGHYVVAARRRRARSRPARS